MSDATSATSGLGTPVQVGTFGKGPEGFWTQCVDCSGWPWRWKKRKVCLKAGEPAAVLVRVTRHRGRLAAAGAHHPLDQGVRPHAVRPTIPSSLCFELGTILTT
ncbi:MAG: hypothetical protein M1826_002403 [Phylliscum demangeonii]|nr:MAG: hypothetical protein M1826_002403 [Phylliscum demangeonii]